MMNNNTGTAIDPAYMRLLRHGAMGGGLGSAIGGLFGLFDKQTNPADAAMPYLNSIPGQTAPHYKPYMEVGRNALSGLMPEFQNLMKNPNDVYNRLSSGYQESPGYQHALREALGASSNAAAAGGMLGTPYAQHEAMETASGIASKDFNNYLNTQLGLYGQGLGGMSDINKMGYNANTSYADMLANLAQQRAQLAYTGQEAENQSHGSNWADIFGGLGHLLPLMGFFG